MNADTLPEQSTRTTLRRLRATLAAWGASDGELVAFQAWGAWAVTVTSAGREPESEVPVYTSLDTARLAALEVTQRVEVATAGLSDELRQDLWRMAHAGNELVWHLLTRRSQRGAATASAAATTKSQTRTPASPQR